MRTIRTIISALAVAALAFAGDAASGNGAPVIAVAWAAPAGAGPVRARHLSLEKASPGAGDTVAVSPDSLRMWFTESVELGLTKVRLYSGARETKVLPPAAVGGVKSAIAVVVPQKLSPGAYTVEWKTAGADGHPATGKYTFVVRAPR